jgi:hypothetical protein
VARRTHQVLLAHMTRYTYSPTGALKWKKDVAEYTEVLRSYAVPSANESMGQLQVSATAEGVCHKTIDNVTFELEKVTPQSSLSSTGSQRLRWWDLLRWQKVCFSVSCAVVAWCLPGMLLECGVY